MSKPGGQHARHIVLMLRLKFLAKAMRSTMRRYPADVAAALRAGGSPAPVHEPLDRAWGELPEQPGLRGVAWLGQCTMLLRFGDVTILTDPVLLSHVGMRVGKKTIGPRRLLPPLHIPGIPRPDLVLISHAHYDHLDRPSLKLISHSGAEVITARHTRGLVPRGFAGIHELDWGHETRFRGIRIRAIRPRHWGARTGWDRHRRYNSYLLDDGTHRVLFVGDTAHTEAFAQVGPVDLAIFGIGAYDPWEHAHATPEQVWQMASSMPAQYLLPVHHSTFHQSDEPHGEPMERLLAAAGADAGRVIQAAPGDVVPWPNSGA